MIERIKDWIYLRGITQTRIRRHAARYATRKMASRHRKRIKRNQRELDARQLELYRLNERITKRKNELDACENKYLRDREEFELNVSELRSAMMEWESVIQFFKTNTGRLFGSFDKVELHLANLNKAHRKRR